MTEPLLRILAFLFLLSGCDLQPKAKLALVEIGKERGNITVLFDSNIDILVPHRANRYQIPTSTGIDCNLGTGVLSEDIDMRADGIRGLVEPVGMTVDADGRTTYRFKSNLVFYEAVRDSPHESKVMGSAEIANLLSKHSRMRCRVRILAYFSNPYFSEPLDMPLGQLRAHVEALAREENSD